MTGPPAGHDPAAETGLAPSGPAGRQKDASVPASVGKRDAAALLAAGHVPCPDGPGPARAGTCELHPHHVCSCTDGDRLAARVRRTSRGWDPTATPPGRDIDQHIEEPDGGLGATVRPVAVLVADREARLRLQNAAKAQDALEDAQARRRAAVAEALDGGCSLAEIAAAMRLPVSTIHNLRPGRP